MRIERICVEGFGRLRDYDTGPEGLEGLVVVLGPNEAGKSTLFDFLTTVLYGFSPASRDGNPYVPWGAEEASGSVSLALDGEGCVEVVRRLRSQPTARVTLGGRGRELRNQPLPWVEHVPRKVFRQVFAVTLREMAALDPETWARIQDRMIASMGATDLRPIRQVAEQLEAEASEVWRPNRRGNQRLRTLKDDLRALRERRTRALERDGTIRRLVQDRDDLSVRLQELRETRQANRIAVDKAQSRLPVLQGLERIEALRAEGGPRDELSQLPPDPVGRRSELQTSIAEMTERLGKIDRDLEEPAAAAADFDEAARRFADRRDEIERFLTTSSAVVRDRERFRDASERIVGVERRLDTTAAGLLSDDWRSHERALTTAPVPLLRARARQLSDLSERGRRTGATPQGLGMHPLAAAGLLALGLPLLVWGLVSGGPVPAAAGTALVALGVTSLWGRFRRGGTRGGRPVGEPEHAGTRGRDPRGEVARILGALPVLESRAADPDEALVSGLEKVQELLAERDELRDARERVGQRIEADDRDARRLAVVLGLDATADATTLGPAMQRELNRAERLQAAAVSAEREIRRLEGERARLGSARDDLRQELTELEQAGAQADGGDPAAGLARLAARGAAHRRADGLQEELERTYPNLEALRTQIEAAEGGGDSWRLDDAELAERQARIELLDEEVEQSIADQQALDAEVASLRREETVDAVDSEIESLGDEERRLVRERDRKWILARLLRQADRRFREEHQPDLIRRASSYLEHLTGGRYDRILVDETSAGALFQLSGPGVHAPLQMEPPISTGTLEQAYLSLRLAIVDHLDRGGERLPLFVDEVFVNWDPDRRRRGLDLVSRISDSRQLFVFTCHPGFAEELATRGGRVLELSGEA